MSNVFNEIAALFDASPRPVPAIGARVYGQTAPAGATQPYAVVSLVARVGLHVQDEGEPSTPNPTRRWMLQLAVFDADRDRGLATAAAIEAFLVTVRQGDAGLQRIMLTGQVENWVEKSKLNQQVLELDVMESIA